MVDGLIGRTSFGARHHEVLRRGLSRWAVARRHRTTTRRDGSVAWMTQPRSPPTAFHRQRLADQGVRPPTGRATSPIDQPAFTAPPGPPRKTLVAHQELNEAERRDHRRLGAELKILPERSGPPARCFHPKAASCATSSP